MYIYCGKHKCSWPLVVSYLGNSNIDVRSYIILGTCRPGTQISQFTFYTDNITSTLTRISVGMICVVQFWRNTAFKNPLFI